MIVYVRDIVKDSFSPIFGKKLWQQVEKRGNVQVENKIVLDLEGVDSFTTLFFNAMFNEIKENYDSETALSIINKLEVENLGDVDINTFDRSQSGIKSKI